jgi:parallel beta-helix repeat protein
MLSLLAGQDNGITIILDELTRKEVARGAAAEVLPLAVKTAGAGGRLLLLPGTYILESTIELPAGFTLCGSGRGTRLRAASGFGGEAMLMGREADQLTLENFALSPMSPDGVRCGILLDRCGDASVHQVFAVGFAEYGIILRRHSFLCRIHGCTTAGNGTAGILLQTLTCGGRGGDYVPNNILGCTSYGERGSGFEADEALCVNFTGCQVFQAARHGFWLHSASNSICISGCRAFECGGSGVLVDGTHEANISSNIFCWNKGHGIELNHAVWATVCGNNVIDSGGTEGGQVHGIYVHTDSRSVQITGNTVFNWEGHQPMLAGILETNECRDCGIVGNHVNYFSQAEGVICEGKGSHASGNVCVRECHAHPEKEPFVERRRNFQTKEFTTERIQKLIGEILA